MLAMLEQKRVPNSHRTYEDMFLCNGRIHPAQSTIYHQGDDFSGYYRVNSGVVMVYRLLEDSQRQISGFYTAGDFFGLSSLSVYGDSAVTVSTSNIVCLSRNTVRNNPELQQQLFLETCAQLDAAQALITTLTKKTASQKIALFLVQLSRHKDQSLEEFDIKLPMSRLDIADYLGLTIETVSRRLTALKTEGIIALPNRNTATVKNYKKLCQIADADF